LPAGPSLAILESLTGDGKTEAAMRLVHRMLAEGRVDGFYFALPTMATANAMYDRLRLTFPRLFQDPAQASLVLAHSARNLVEAFRDSIIPAVESRDDPSREEASAEARCQAWLADRGKKALLAQGGVGTLDQALLAVLQAKHQSLRLLGLYRKVLVVDEVHAYDPYMHQTLQELLRFHAAAGGSAILLSATLPFRMRQALVEAFAAGADLQRKALGSSAYPLATVLNSEGVQEIPVAVSPEKHRSILVHRLDSEEAVVARVLEAESRGQCACWIRNTVSGAVEAFRRLSSAMQEPSRLALFHARCALGDRLDREREIIRWFGRHSTETARTGRILVATQVVEQSLDLDFDVLVTDPAPIDLLLQRSGRLCRHPRDGRGNPLPPGAADGRAEPCLNILAPNPVDDASENWMDALSLGTTLVYPDPAALWRSLRALVRAHHFRLPQDARQLIEAVYGSDPEPAPEALRKREGTARGKGQAERAVARQNTLDLATGFQALGATWLPDAVVPTRLGDPSATFRLAKWDGTTLLPWRDKEPAFSWEMSEIRVRKAQAEAPYFEGDGPLTKAVEVVNATLPDRGRWTQVLPLQQMDNDGPWLGKVVDGKGKVHKIQYDPEIGLEFVKGA
jgi:CRISPR-associated endonuclease/helicase Cas3